MKSIIAFISAAGLLLVGCESSNVKLLKSSQVKCMNYKNVEEMINGNLNKPSWEDVIGTDGNQYVNITGIMPKADNAMVTFQYRIYPEQETAQFYTVQSNGERVNALFALAYFKAMCEE